ncbi:MAG: VacJ family lipoprotein [Pseudomonadota bacterium]|nr:VacJ family lipoprotein [Pseudomonadota bacterium]
MMRNKWIGLAASVGFMLAAGYAHAAAAPASADDQADNAPAADDPLESVNRGIYQFNYAFDTYALRPVTVGYRFVVPEKGREMVSNFLENLYTPVVFINSVLQGDPQNSFSTLWRFLINSTMGIGGVFDVASEAGLKNRQADFGETMAFYGVGSGPFIELPVLGPSNVRDAFGRLGDAFMLPTNYATSNNVFSGNTGDWIEYGTWVATAIDQRSRNMKLIDDIYSTSLDPYTTFKSAYTQHRVSKIRRDKASRDKALAKGYCKE